MGPSLRLRHGQSLNNNNTSNSNRGNRSSTGPPPPPQPKRAAAAVVKKEPSHRGDVFKAEESEVIAAEIVVWTGNDEVEMEDDGEEDAVSVASSGELSSVPDSPLSVRSTPVPGRGESVVLDDVSGGAQSELSLEEGIPEKEVEESGWVKPDPEVDEELEVAGPPEVEEQPEVDEESWVNEELPAGEEEQVVGEEPQIENEPQVEDEPRIDDEPQNEDEPRIEENVPEQTMYQMDGQEQESVLEAEPEKAAYVSRTDETGPISPMTTVRLTT